MAQRMTAADDLTNATPATLRRIVGRQLGAIARKPDPAARAPRYERAAEALDRLDAVTAIDDEDGRGRLAVLQERYRRHRARFPAPPTRHPIPRQREIGA